MTIKKHTLSILVDNRPGVLSRVIGLFSGRGFNIESLCVAETMDLEISRITIITKAAESVVEQIEKQLHKLINVINVYNLTDVKTVHREMALIKVHAKPDTRAEILRIIDIFRCKIVDVGFEHYTVEVTGNEGKIFALLTLLRPMGIMEIAKTGMVALSRELK